MPRVSAFYGIVIAMYFRDHSPPHFHATYGEFTAKIEIATGEVFEGDLPPRAKRLIREWTNLHRSELDENWTLARARRPLASIDPLP
jgi:uncharacterized protein DUF4160